MLRLFETQQSGEGAAVDELIRENVSLRDTNKMQAEKICQLMYVHFIVYTSFSVKLTRPQITEGLREFLWRSTAAGDCLMI